MPTNVDGIDDINEWDINDVFTFAFLEGSTGDFDIIVLIFGVWYALPERFPLDLTTLEDEMNDGERVERLVLTGEPTEFTTSCFIIVGEIQLFSQAMKE